MYFPEVIHILTLCILNEIYKKKSLLSAYYVYVYEADKTIRLKIYSRERERENSTTVMNSRPGAGLVFSVREE